MSIQPLRSFLSALYAVILIGASGCSAPPPEDAAASASRDATGETASPEPVPSASIAAGTAASEQTTAPSLAACLSGDGRTPVFVWRATADANGLLSVEPPQQDGEIVRVELRAATGATDCTGNGPHTFRRPDDAAAPTAGGLVVQIHGTADSTCTFSGYYLSEEKPGADENWGETHFTPRDSTQIQGSDQYCLLEE